MNQARAETIAPASGEGLLVPLRELLKVAAPTVATMTSYTLMTFTDKFLVSRIGPEPIYVGAQGNGGLASWVAISVAQGTLMVINTYVSQHLGAGKPERGPAYAWNGMWLASAYWLLVLVPYSAVLPWVFGLARIDPAQAELASRYGRILLWGSVLTMSTRAMSQFFYGMHRAGVVLIAGVVANVLNLVLCAVLVYGDGAPAAAFGLFGRVCHALAAWGRVRAMGVEGSAWGTLIATGVELAIPMSVFLGRAMHRKYATRSAWRWSGGHVRELLRIGWPGGLMFGNEMICWGFFMVYLVSHFGRLHATAGWIAHQFMSLSFMPAVGISVAVTATVGRCMGMGRADLAARRAWIGIGLAAAYMSLCGVLFVVFRRELVGWFIDAGTPAEDVETLVALGANFLIATAAFQFFDGIAMTVSGALRGAGDTTWPGVATVLLAWGVIVGGGLGMVRYAPGLESLGPWMAAAAYIILLGSMLLIRFVSGRWRRIRLVEAAVAVH